MFKKSNTEEFIIKSRVVHGMKYDYSKVVYINCSTKIIIICPNHGEFKQTPNYHLSGEGCRKCQYDNLRLNTNDFITKAKLIHGDKYNYEKVDYNTVIQKVIIVCPDHGEFKQIPHSHFRGRGCPLCSNKVSKPQLEFLEYCGLTNNDCEVKFGKYSVDGFKNGIIYEFLGDYWHGNPEIFNPIKINKRNGKTFGQLNMFVFDRFNALKTITNHTIKFIWELDWNNFKNGEVNIPKIQIHA